jgi:hypothetical protein
MTNRFTTLLNNSIREMDEFADTDAGRAWESTWYEDLKRLVLRAASENDTQRAEELLDMVSWSIVDTGPAGGEFCPSINLAQDMLVKIRLERDRAGP